MEKYLVGFSQEFSLTVSVNGRLDAIATWFDLHLDCDHYVTSAPGSGSCWEQGVYPVLPSQLNSGVYFYKNVDLSSLALNHLTFTCVTLGTKMFQKNTWDSLRDCVHMTSDIEKGNKSLNFELY